MDTRPTKLEELMTETQSAEMAFCYHCRTFHPKSEMRQLHTRSGKRWRCVRSIEATHGTRASRDAFGQYISERNRAESEARARMFLHPLPYR